VVDSLFVAVSLGIYVGVEVDIVCQRGISFGFWDVPILDCGLYGEGGDE
jgi:hypothetical protein